MTMVSRVQMMIVTDYIGPRLLPLGEDVVCNSVELSSGETWALDPGSILTPQWSHKGGEGGQPLATEFWPTGHGGER